MRMKKRCTALAAMAMIGMTSVLANGPAGRQLPVNDVLTTPGCHVVSDRIAPAGFTEHELTWEEVFFGASFPNSSGFPAPTGSFTLRALAPASLGPTMNGRYITVPFVPKQNEEYKVSWLYAQPVKTAGYFQSRPASGMFVSVSSCKGDLRQYQPLSPSAALRHCRLDSPNGDVRFGTKPTSFCRLTAGQQYYLNITLAPTIEMGPLSTTKTTCQSAYNLCEANFKAEKIN